MIGPRPFTAVDDATIRREASRRTWREMGRMMGRSWSAVQNRAHKLGIKRGNDKVEWTAGEIAELRRLFPVSRTADVADALGRSISAVSIKARDLGIRKDPDHLKRRSSTGGKICFARGSFHAQRRAAPIDNGVYTPTEDAVRHMQRIGPVWRCDADGATNPKGDYWKFSGRVLDAAAVEARAERAGWVRP